MRPPRVVAVAVALVGLAAMVLIVSTASFVFATGLPVVSFVIPLAVVVLAAGAIAWGLWRGSPWSRVVVTALAAFALVRLVLSVLVGVCNPEHLAALLAAGAAVLLWLPTARPHFRRR